MQLPQHLQQTPLQAGQQLFQAICDLQAAATSHMPHACPHADLTGAQAATATEEGGSAAYLRGACLAVGTQQGGRLAEGRLLGLAGESRLGLLLWGRSLRARLWAGARWPVGAASQVRPSPATHPSPTHCPLRG